MSAGRRWAIIGTGVVVAVALIVGGLVVLLQTPGEYSSGDQARFMSACMGAAGEPARPTCACIYDTMSRSVPYSQFVAINNGLGSQTGGTQPLPFPEPVESIRTGCLTRGSAPPTTG
jgi:hypothetical protein